MALKNNFEATSDVFSPFVDEIANTGHVSEQTAASTRKAGAKFLSKEQTATIARTDKQIADAAAPKGDSRNTGQKIMDRDQKLRDALGN